MHGAAVLSLVLVAAFALALAFAAGGVGRADAAPRRATIVIVPVGTVDGKAVAALVPEVGAAFHADVVVGPAQPLPAGAYDRSRDQTLSTAILDALAKTKRPEHESVLGVADVDLYVPDLNFVFGEADARRRVAVFSLHRLHAAPSEQAIERERALTEAVHELGHVYGLRHCTNRRCVMWFSNTLAESDAKGHRFCAAHQAELDRAIEDLRR